MMEINYIYNILLDRGYNSYSAKLVAEDLSELSVPLKGYLKHWIENESFCENFTVEGYSIHQLQKERKMNYPAALLTIDWLIKDPEKAKESLGRKIR